MPRMLTADLPANECDVPAVEENLKTVDWRLAVGMELCMPFVGRCPRMWVLVASCRQTVPLSCPVRRRSWSVAIRRQDQVVISRLTCPSWRGTSRNSPASLLASWLARIPRYAFVAFDAVPTLLILETARSCRVRTFLNAISSKCTYG
jgi:hypothetical protein